MDKQPLIFFQASHSLPPTMTRVGQRDPVDPSLIVESSRVSQPSKQVRGVDYPETVGNTVGRLKSGASSSQG